MPTINDPWLFFNNPSLLWGGIVLLVLIACMVGPSRLR